MSIAYSSGSSLLRGYRPFCQQLFGPEICGRFVPGDEHVEAAWLERHLGHNLARGPLGDVGEFGR